MSDSNHSADVFVYGATPAGIAAAVAAARVGRSVILAESRAHAGGMAASGLGKSDVEKPEYIGGLFREFTSRVHRYYGGRYGAYGPQTQLSKRGYYYEPHVAELVFDTMLAECRNLTVLKRHRLESAHRDGSAVAAVALRDTDSGFTRHIQARVFLDATYEGDLYAAAGAAFRLGRESRDEFGESLAGHIYYDYENGIILPGSTGAGDGRLPAWTYRLYLSTDPQNAVPLESPPPGYDRAVYTPYFEDLEAGRLGGPKVFHEGRGYFPEHFNTMVRALSVTRMPNGTADVNINPRPLAFPFPGENEGYVDGDWDARERIEQRHRDLCLGLLWFLQNDEEIPADHRRLARAYQLPRSEFADNGHFPWQLYIREARRLDGCYTITQHDVALGEGGAREFHHDDVIAMGEFPIDSFPAQRRQPGDSVVLEGYLGMLGHLTRPYKIPYRAMLPREVDGLIVPGALSATHVAYSSIRMEPTWMALGHASGAAAHLAIQHACPARDVPIEELRGLLRAQGQVVDPPK
ncbi:MAG: FAD-dependent oxidoreductase [Candidatus Hydrogenedentes bacterium]|nr:FAD-dependent oxidoreductase [Candidatus Hydrogenedentota bacterium]